ncbi:MAG: DUF6785 family protein, partial [Thermofilaceae archaeon]
LQLFASLVLFGAFIGITGVLTTPFVPGWLGWSTLLAPTSAPLVILFILLLLARFTGISISSQKLALLFTASAMGVAFCYSWVPYGIIHNSAALRQNQYNWHPTNWAVPNYWVFGPIVSDPAEMTPITTGGPVPLDKWTPFLTWWITYTILWLLFFTGWIGLLQERWMIAERLPFPVAIPGTMQIELISSKGKDPRIKYFMLGALVGALVILPVIATYISPAFPDIYGWTREPFIPWFLGAIDFSRTPLGTVIIPISVFPINPLYYVQWYIVPSKISFTVWAFQLFGILVPSQIAFYMGYYSDLPTMANRFHAFMNGAPFRWNGWYVGAAFGLILIWLILNARYSKEIFIGADRTMPGKLGIAMIIGSTVGLLAMLLIAGVNAVAAPLIILSMWLIYVGAVRQAGLSYITSVPGDWTQLPTLVRYLYIPDPGYITAPDGSQVRPPEMVATLWLANRPTAVLFGYGGIVSSIPICYKVGFDTGTNLRDITKLILVIGVISAIIGYPLALWFSYTIGTNNTRMGMFDAWWHWVFGCPWSKVEEAFITEPLAPYLVAGFVLIALVSFLNFRFVWWPLDPVGIVVALGGAFATGYILPAFIGWIAKRLVYRIGGAKLDESVAMPFTLGFIVGYLMCQTLGGIVVTIQFFLPK